MTRVSTGLGLILLLVTGAYAQNPADKPSKSPDTGTTATANQTPNTSTASTGGEKQNKTSGTANKKDKEPVQHHTRVRLGGIGVSAGYAHFAPGFYPYYYPYSPFSAAAFWDPFWDFYPPYYPAGYFGQGTGKGELKLVGAPKTASVYVDGGYAGTVDKLRSFWLEPGAYDLEVSAKDGSRFQQRVYVLTGKSLKIEARLEPAKQGEHP